MAACYCAAKRLPSSLGAMEDPRCSRYPPLLYDRPPFFGDRARSGRLTPPGDRGQVLTSSARKRF